MKRIRKTTNRIFANPTAVPAMPVKPSAAAINAMIRNAIAQLNISNLSLTVLSSHSFSFVQTACQSNPLRSPSGLPHVWSILNKAERLFLDVHPRDLQLRIANCNRSLLDCGLAGLGLRT
jgi:hypothetical protein